MEKQSTRFSCIIYPEKHNGNLILTDEARTKHLVLPPPIMDQTTLSAPRVNKHSMFCFVHASIKIKFRKVNFKQSFVLLSLITVLHFQKQLWLCSQICGGEKERLLYIDATQPSYRCDTFGCDMCLHRRESITNDTLPAENDICSLYRYNTTCNKQMPYLHEKFKVNAKTMAHEFSLSTLAISLQKLFLYIKLISSKIRFMKILSLTVLRYSCYKASQSIGCCSVHLSVSRKFL